MKKYFFKYALLACLLVISSCKKDNINADDEEPNLNNPILQLENERLDNVVPDATVFAFLQGYIEDEFGNPLADATVKVSGISKTTDVNGYFLFEGIDLNESYAMVSATKEGYHRNFRTFTPKANTVQTVKIQLLAKGISKNFNSNSGGILEFESGKVKLDFPAKSIIKRDGSTYNGNVNVIARYIDPESENLLNVMPGMLAGLTNDDEMAAMITYGMVTVELTDNNGNALEVNPDSKVEVRLPASPSSPAEIPLWHFNETYGLWIEAGTATKVGNEYVGEVNHFSTWNLDVFSNGSVFHIKVKNEENVPLANAIVEVLDENFEVRFAEVYTDNNGEFTLLNAPQSLGFKLITACETVEILPITIGDSMFVIVNENNLVSIINYTLSGNVRDCDNVLYNNKWVHLNSEDANYSFFGLTDEQGQFSFSNLLCDINPNISYSINARIFLDITSDLVKDLNFDITFSGTNQDITINYCGVEEDVISDTFVVIFTDPNLEQKVRNALGQPNDPLRYGSVKVIDSLNAFGSNITNLDGLQYLTGLKNLILFGNQISDISTLANLQNLEKLDVSANQISNISAIESLVNLVELSLLSNQISDINPLANLENLEKLYLTANQISDINPLANLLRLEVLQLRNNQIANISPITSLINLTDLNLMENQIVDISALANLVKLETLFMRYNEIIDIGAIENLVSLKQLGLNDNEIVNISPLANLENLTNLNLWGNKILNLTPLCNIESLVYINLSLNQPPFTPTQKASLEACLPSTEIDW